jgi:hypothetical protein
MPLQSLFFLLLVAAPMSSMAFVISPAASSTSTTVSLPPMNHPSRLYAEPTIVSPFDNDGAASTSSGTTMVEKSSGPLDLTWENVEMVLDEMRPYLIQDGGNVAIKDIDGPVVRLELQVCLFAYICLYDCICMACVILCNLLIMFMAS